jgi:hypothetical protein
MGGREGRERQRETERERETAAFIFTAWGSYQMLLQ